MTRTGIAVGAVVVASLLIHCGGRVEGGPVDDVDACTLLGCVPTEDADAGPDGPRRPDGAGEPGRDASPDVDVDGATSNEGGLCRGPGARFATSVVDHAFGTGQDFNQKAGFPQAIFGPPAAGDASSVVSLGNGGWVIVAFDGNAIVDGPGPDFIVFENPLPNFKELATVAVSDDGATWFEFPCDAPRGAADYGTCAGVNVVNSSPKNGIDPLDPTVAGGDAFDLALLGVARARFVRITDRVDLDGPDGVFDLDAVAIINAACP